MTRPLIQHSLAELAAQVGRNVRNDGELELVEQELRKRKTPSARILLEKVGRLRAELKGSPATKLNSANAPTALPADVGRKKEEQGRLPMTRMMSPPAQLPTNSGTRERPITDKRRWTEEAVAALRTRLIDLSKKSPLISFKHGGRSASILRIVDERIDLLCQLLEEGGLGFEPLPGEDETPRDEALPTFRIAHERARLTDEAFLAATQALEDDERDARAWQEAERALRASVRAQLGMPALDYGKTLDVKATALAHGFDPSYDLRASDDDDVADHHGDDRIRVLLTAKDLDKRLKTIWERYTSHQRETGLHTLSLCLGFVQWFDDDAADDALHAPLLLRSVSLAKKQVRSRWDYTLSAHDDGLQVNVALIEKARQHWGLELPGLREDESPESYFIRVDAVLAAGRRLSLRRFATLAVLPFPRMVLWKDLDPAAWPDAAFADHRLLPALVGAAPLAGEASVCETIDIDSAEWSDAAPALIRPADASQHSALIDVAAGHDLAVEGPPGTGKSETITNMIATALSAGQRVLFVAEKQAALQVVAKRLRDSGFGPLLLELHGDTANRTDVYNGLRERLKAKVSTDQATLAARRRQLRGQRDTIKRYQSLIGAPLGSLGRTTYWLLWREVALRAGIDRTVVDAVAKRWQPVDPRAVDAAMLADARGRLDTYGDALGAIDREAGDGERTLWVRAAHLDPFDQRRQREAAREASEAARAMAEAVRALDKVAPLGFPEPGDALDEAAAQLESTLPFEPVEEAVARAALRDPDTAGALLLEQARWRQLCAGLAKDVAQPEAIADAAIGDLAAAIAASGAAPPTVAIARERLVEAQAVLALGTEVAADQAMLAAHLELPATSTVAEIGTTLDALAALDGEPAVVAALYRAELLDPLAETVLSAERARASVLAGERDELASATLEDSHHVEVAELERLSDVLADSGIVARLVGRDYKSAKRRVARLVRDVDDRLATAELLRRMARHRTQVATFRATSIVAPWFPPVLWTGIDADWDALSRARAVLVDARRQFADARHGDAMRCWLAASPDERARMSTGARRVAPLLVRAQEAGLDGCPASSLGGRLREHADALTALDRALNAVGALPTGALTRDGDDLAARLGALRDAARDFDALRTHDEMGWVVDVAVPLDRLAHALHCADSLRAAQGPLRFVQTLVEADAPAALLGAILARREAWLTAEVSWRAATAGLAEAAGLAPPTGTGWHGAAQTLASMADDETGARLVADLQKYGRALIEVDVGAPGAAALDGTVPGDRLADLYELLLVRALLTEYLGGDGGDLGRLGSLTLDQARREFTRFDKELHVLEARAIVAKRLGDKPPEGIGFGPRATWTEMSLLDNEIAPGRKRWTVPIRDVVHRAGAAMQVLQPVWMMSPTSAAQYIRPGSLDFDLLVVDEASQLRPEFALSAVLRGKQFVVVGDANQLPPSDHFQTSVPDGSDGNDDGSVTPDAESILDLANGRFRRKRRLRWHYRSQHESLIQFSNHEFYGRDLIVFPSPMGNDHDLLGVKCTYVPALHRDTYYEASINQREAQAVIEEAFRLMRSYPEHSIGIAAMNAKQTELIQNEFDRLILEQPEIRKYVEEYAGDLEEFFIKNLENVQGDERDIILISTVYGPDKHGKVAQNFGLMNREVGWRRLNVLVTRAKLSVRLFTSLMPADVKADDASSRGLRALKAYLTYAHGGARYTSDAGGDPDSDFEVFVADALRQAGYEVVPQVGVEGFRIDLGVRHPDYPLGFIAGIECDGASFHTGLTVRDRDRIRQSVLEAMGWRIYRIWSTDWFADPARELARLLARLDEWRAAFASAGPPLPPLEPGPVDNAPSDDPLAIAAPPPPPPVERSSPEGRAMRPLEDIAWYETIKGRLYEVWLDDALAGEVEVLSRATAAPRLYASQVFVARSEYEGRVQATGERFKSHDIHAAVRDVARRAREIQPVDA